MTKLMKTIDKIGHNDEKEDWNIDGLVKYLNSIP